MTGPIIAAQFVVLGCEESDEAGTSFPVEYIRYNRRQGVAVRIVHFLFSSRRDAGDREKKNESRGSEKGGIKRWSVETARNLAAAREWTRSSGEKGGSLEAGVWRWREGQFVEPAR